MGSEWSQSTLGVIACGKNGLVDGPFGSNLPASSYTEEGVPVIRGSNLAIGLDRFSADSFVYVSEATAERLSRSLCHPGDIIFTKKGTIGQTGYVPEGLHKRFLLSSNQMKLTVDQLVVDPLFVYYYVSSAESVAKILRDSESTGVPKINLAYLKTFPIMLPSLEKQTAIARFLGAIDDKIELNRQMNTTLETMAQALFKSWFVDFDPVIDNALAAGNPIPDELAARAERRKQTHDRKDASSSEHFKPGQPLPAAIQQQFPDRFVFTEAMGWVPEGWEAVSLNEIIELIGGGTPKTSIEEYWGGDIPWFSVVDAPAQSNVFVSRTEKYISALGLENSSTKMLREGTTIISARGTVGKCALVGKPMTMNQSCYGIQGKSGIADYFVYYTILLRVADLQQRGHGSVFNTITRDTFKSITTPRCPVELTQRFHDLIAGFFSRILENNQQSDCLASLRDTLLPKLLSGQLRIPEAEQQVAEIV